MKNTTNNLIFYSLILLASLLLGVLFVTLMPEIARADIIESDSFDSGMRNVTYSFDGEVDTEEINTRLLPERREFEVISAPSTTTPRQTASAPRSTSTASTSKAQSTQKATEVEEENLSNLAAGAIFGGDGFLPSGIIQWLLLAILVLLIVMIVRKLFGGEDRYHREPLKHA